MNGRNTGWRGAIVLLLLMGLHFYVRPRFGGSQFTPDFLAIGVLLFALRARPGEAALAGLAAGLIADSLTPARFGAGMLAHTVVGYLAAWGRAVFFADNILVTAGFFAVGTWLRNLLVILAVLLRGWLDLRIRE